MKPLSKDRHESDRAVAEGDNTPTIQTQYTTSCRARGATASYLPFHITIWKVLAPPSFLTGAWFFLLRSPSAHDHIIGWELRPRAQLRWKVTCKLEGRKHLDAAAPGSSAQCVGALASWPAEGCASIRQARADGRHKHTPLTVSGRRAAKPKSKVPRPAYKLAGHSKAGPSSYFWSPCR